MPATHDSGAQNRQISSDLLLARIEEVQEELHSVLTGESLEGMEALTSELSSRLRSLTALGAEELTDPSGERRERLRRIAAVQRELADYAAERLKGIGAELKHASASRALGHKYTIDPARARARLLNCMDLEG